MIEKLIRPVIQDFVPYQWEPSTALVAQRYNIPDTEVIRFDTNTSPFLPYDFQESLPAYGREIPNVNEYGDSSYTALREALAIYHGCLPEQVVIGAGADELIEMVAKLFLNNRDRAVISTPTYPVYALATELMGGQIIEVPRGPGPYFELDVEQLAQTALAQNAKIVWLCNPNNPTASAVSIEVVEQLLQRLDGRAILAIDEAYSEYWKQTALPLVADHPNLLIIRTFSKAFSLAGARVGCIIAQAQAAEYLNRVRPPNSVSNLSVALACHALQPAALAEMRRRVEFILTEKARFVTVLNNHCEEVYPSVANFVLARIGPPAYSEEVAQHLLTKGIIVRRPGSMPGHFRLTVRLPAENDRLIKGFGTRG